MRSQKAVLLAVVVASAACSRTQGAPAPAARRGGAVAVRVEPVAVRDVVYAINAVGSLEADQTVQVTADVEGPVTAVLFDEGTRVSPQTPLARIDPEKFALEARRAENALKTAQADLQRAENDLTRREQLARENLVSAEDLSRARAERDRLAGEMGEAEAAYRLAQQNRARSEVRAPAAGVINTKTVEKGQWVRGGGVLATIVDTSRLRLRFKVSEGESLKARKGQPVRFTVKALGDARFEGTIYHVGEVADPATRQVEVLAWVKNPGVLKPGFFAEVQLASDTRQGATIVRERAVQASERGFVAYTVQDGKARVKPVEIGIRTGDGYVEILSGLQAGEPVIVEGNDRIADGVPVHAAGAPSAAGPGAPGAGGSGPAASR